MGKTTAERLTAFGIIADLVPDTESSAGLLDKFGAVDIKDKKVLLPQAKVTSRELPEGLAALGAAVEEIAVYETVEIESANVDLEHIDQILFMSGSTAKAFVKKFGKVPPHIKAYCLGKPTQASAKKHGIDAEIVPARDN
ncbi:MAG: uroporphyrinogen-III synthase [Planctomycetota bacterium]|nr:uroporphyrinogen-III synthase [Planctomycetota bacterium]